MKLIDGKATAAAIKEEIKAEVDQMIASGMKRRTWLPCSWVTTAAQKPT